MDKDKARVHFVAGILLVVFAVVIFCVAGGAISLSRLRAEDGSHPYNGHLLVLVFFDIAMFAIAGVMAVLHDSMLLDWLQSCGVILVLGAIGFLFSVIPFAGWAISALYGLWAVIGGIRSFLQTWDGFNPDSAIALCRVVLGIALFSFVYMWFTLPNEINAANAMTPESTTACIVAGVLAIVGGAATFIEGLIWTEYCEY